MERVISLLPSATEIVCALGLEAMLVGRSHECDEPASVRRLPVCTEPKLDPAAPSAEIDRRVRALVRDGLSVYRVDAEGLRALRPDVILTQQQCEVCAVTPRDLDGALQDWLGARPRLVSLEPETLADVIGDVRRVADALDSEEEGRRVAAQLGSRLADVGERSGDAHPRPSVAVLEWIDPLMTAGHWIPELVELAGGVPLLARSGQPSAWIDLGQLRDADPDLIVVAPCGFDLARTRSEVRTLLAQPGFRSLRAVRSGRVALADALHFFSRPGPRLVETAQVLAEMLHPARGAFGHRGRAWAWLAD